MIYDRTQEDYWIDLLSSYQELNYRKWRCYIVNVRLK